MAQTGFTPVQLYRTTTASAAPSAGNLADGELAINLTDEKLYFKNAAGVVKMLASSAGALGTVSSVDVSGGTTGLTTSGGPITTSGTITLGGTLGVANGGTGTTTQFTAGSVVFAGASGVYSQDNANLFWDDTNNRLGIGTTSPSNKLQVSGDDARSAAQAATTAGRAFLEAQASDYWSGSTFAGASLSQFGSAATGTTVGLSNASLGMLRFQNGSAGLIYTNGAAPIVFGTNSTERMRIDSAGNVGIGTSSPTYLLDVSSASNTAIRATNTDATSFTIIGAAAGTSAFQIRHHGQSHATTPNLSQLISVSGAIAFNPASSEAMRITTSGNVGIGTSSPGGRLDLNGNFVSNITAVAASAIDCTSGNFFTKTASGALAWTISSAPASRAYSFLLELTNGGTGTQTWFTGTKWPGGTAPTLTASGVDLLGFITDDGGTTWRGVQLMKDSK